MTVPDILQYLNILKTSSSIRLTQLVTIFVAVCLTGAGLVHLLENSGDFFKGFINPHRITYADSVYFVLVTMSTVGYGDIYCTTLCGRLFMIFFILFGLVSINDDCQSKNCCLRLCLQVMFLKSPI